MTDAATPPLQVARRPRRKPSLRWLQPAVLVGALVPLADMIARAVLGKLGANPIAEVLNRVISRARRASIRAASSFSLAALSSQARMSVSDLTNSGTDAS